VSNLDELRQQIDDLDQKLVQLLNERAQVVVEVGKLKRNNSDAPPIYAPDRERTVLDKIKKANKGPLPDSCLMAIYRELMSGSFVLERPLRIAYLGPEGSFSHMATILKFGQSVEHEPVSDIRGVFEEISRQHSDLGVVPVENSIVGGILETLDSLIDSTVHICAEMLLTVHHHLMANCSFEEIKVVYSKPEVLAQCRNWLSSTLPNASIIPAASTAQAAQKASAEINSAAVGSKLAAELYGLRTVCDNIEDVTNNVTRFFVIGPDPARPTGDDKTSLVFSTAHKVGALADCLQAFRYNGVNLTNIESRPSKKREREYYFFVDCQGHQNDVPVQQAIQEAKRHCLQLSILGSFPRATEIL